MYEILFDDAGSRYFVLTDEILIEIDVYKKKGK